MGQSNCHFQSGDQIVISGPLYQNCAFYVGDGYVINVTGDGATSLGTSSTQKAMVKEEFLKMADRNNKWHVKNKYDCSYTPRPVEEIIQRAEHWFDKKVPYDVVGSNCDRALVRRGSL